MCESKQCTKCGNTKPLSEYDTFLSRGLIERPHKKCRDCRTKKERPGTDANGSLILSEKKCGKCLDVKPISEFPTYLSKGITLRIHHLCKECKRAKDRKTDRRVFKADAPVKTFFLDKIKIGAVCPVTFQKCLGCGRIKYYKYNLPHNVRYLDCCPHHKWIESHQGRFCHFVIAKCKGCGTVKRYVHNINVPKSEYLSCCRRDTLVHTKNNVAERDVTCGVCSSIFKGYKAGSMCPSCVAESKRAYRRHGKRYKNAKKRALRYGVQYQHVKRSEVIAKDGMCCYMCGRRVVLRETFAVNQLHIDHVVPISKGGPHTLSNLRVMCATCNMEKRDRLLNDHILLSFKHRMIAIRLRHEANP